MKYFILSLGKHSVRSHKNFDRSCLICWKIKYLCFQLIQSTHFLLYSARELQVGWVFLLSIPYVLLRTVLLQGKLRPEGLCPKLSVAPHQIFWAPQAMFLKTMSSAHGCSGTNTHRHNQHPPHSQNHLRCLPVCSPWKTKPKCLPGPRKPTASTRTNTQVRVAWGHQPLPRCRWPKPLHLPWGGGEQAAGLKPFWGAHRQ